MNEEEIASQDETPEPVSINVDRDLLTQGIQISIGDESGGYRLSGPKYSGNSVPIVSHILNEQDAIEIRRYLDKAFPQHKINVPNDLSGEFNNNDKDENPSFDDHDQAIKKIDKIIEQYCRFYYPGDLLAGWYMVGTLQTSDIDATSYFYIWSPQPYHHVVGLATLGKRYIIKNGELQSPDEDSNE